MSANIGYLFTKDFYRDEQAQEMTVLENDAIHEKVERILKERPFAEQNLRRLCLPCRVPVAETAKPKPPMDVEQMDKSLLALAEKYGNKRGFAEPAPKPAKAPSLPSEGRLLSEQSITRISLQVLYPGLYAGMGYLHGQNGSEKDFKTGFSFDYTTGLPYLPGSSVKGALRACFMNCPEDTLAALPQEVRGTGGQQMLERLERRIFGSRTRDQDKVQGDVVFYDAFPGETRGTLMARDYITPHTDPLGSPQPIQTIKVKTGVMFDFFFRIPEVVLVPEGGQPRVERKHVRQLFETLLLDWGVGAKTNTGYGNLAKTR
jgi:CRISPR-associated protein Cmr6